jgi:hypothetical protein
MARPLIRRVAPVLAVCGLFLALPAQSPAGGSPLVRLPASGELLAPTAAVRAQPNPDGRVVRVLRRFRPDRQFETVLALRARRGPAGAWWYELSLPGRPNGQRGWIRSGAVDLRPVKNRIVVRVGARRLEVRRIADGQLLLRTVVAVGKPGAETPLGNGFYVRARFLPGDPFYGPSVLETTAYSKRSDWPGPGLAGIHGTNRPDLLGQAVSHGCVRVSNEAAWTLRRLAPLGTPVDLRP